MAEKPLFWLAFWMKRWVGAFGLMLVLASPAHAFTDDTGTFRGLEFIAETEIAGPDGTNLSLCYVTQDFRILGLNLVRNVQSYALSSDGCTEEIERPFTREQIQTAQALGIVDPSLSPDAENSVTRLIQNYGLWSALGLALIAVIIRRVKSILKLDPNGTLRKKAWQRILTAMCYAARSDGSISGSEALIIEKTVERLTKREVKPGQVDHIGQQISMDLDPEDFVEFGRGLRDFEKDIMMRGVFIVVMASGRILYPEYEFVAKLADGLGMPGEDFRRVMNDAITDLNDYPISHM